MTGFAIHRRGVLAGLAAGAGAAVLPGMAGARAPAAPRPLAVLDPALTGAPARLAVRLDAALAPMRTGEDPMRLWRARIAPSLTDGAPILGLTSWSDYLVLRGSAAETRRRVRLEVGPDGAAHRLPGDADAALADLAARFRALVAAEPAPNGRIAWILA